MINKMDTLKLIDRLALIAGVLFLIHVVRIFLGY